MKSNVEKINSVQRKLSITVPHEKVNKALTDTYKRYQRKTKIHGFRLGKAPLYLIKNNYQSQVFYDVSDFLIDKSIKSALEEHKLNPIAAPNLDNLEKPVYDKDFCFTATVDVFPTIALGEHYKNLEVSYPVKSLSEEDVESEIKAIRRHYAKTQAFENLEQCLEAKDHLAVVSYESFLKDQRIERLCHKSKRVAMGHGELPSEIEKTLVGMRKGESKEITTNLSGDPEFSEQEIKLVVNLDDLMMFSLPELNDDFAKELKQKSVKELRLIIKKNLAQRVDQVNRSQKENALLSELQRKVPFDVPPVIVDQVIDGMIQDLYGSHKDFKTLMQNKDLRKSLVPEAKKKAKNTLLLWDIAKAENIDVSDKAIKAYITKSLGTNGDAKKIEEIFSNSKERIKETLVFEKTLEVILSSAKLTTMTPMKR